jgi:hypothetical protein
MEFDNNVDEDSSEDQADYLEDSNSDEMVFTDENINRKLEEALKSFKLSCR